jgi:uncharacterized protein YqeY
MSLKERLEADLKSAMRDQRNLERDTLRLALSALKYRRIELGKELDDAEVIASLQKGVKSREESAGEYTKAGRPELAAKERAEAAVLAGYLPKLLDEAATRELVRAAIAEHGIADKKQLGALMKAVLAKHQGQVDAKLVNRLAGELLG